MASEVLVGAGTGAASGAAMGGMVGGPWGALIGGGVGLAAGALGGMGQRSQRKSQQAALDAQIRAQRREREAQARDVGSVREAFGDVWSLKDLGAGPASIRHAGSSGNSEMRTGALIGTAILPGFGTVAGGAIGKALGRKKGRVETPYDKRRQDAAFYQKRDKTLQAHSSIAGGIERRADAVRDAGSADLTAGAQQAAVAQRGASLSRGLMGSSLDESARRHLLTTYAGGRSNVAAAAEGSRVAGWQGIRSRQAQLEAAARGGQRLGSVLSRTNVAGEVAGARAQLPYTVFGNLLNTGIGIADMGLRAGAQGGQGFDAFRLGLPGAGKGDQAAGATTSRGR
jgi:hypothetical protein